MDITPLLFSGCQSLDIPITPEQLNKFQLYCDFLIEYNQNVNLTAVTYPPEIVKKHFLDSLYPLPRAYTPQLQLRGRRHGRRLPRSSPGYYAPRFGVYPY